MLHKSVNWYNFDILDLFGENNYHRWSSMRWCPIPYQWIPGQSRNNMSGWLSSGAHSGDGIALVLFGIVWYCMVLYVLHRVVYRVLSRWLSRAHSGDGPSVRTISWSADTYITWYMIPVGVKHVIDIRTQKVEQAQIQECLRGTNIHIRVHP